MALQVTADAAPELSVRRGTLEVNRMDGRLDLDTADIKERVAWDMTRHIAQLQITKLGDEEKPAPAELHEFFLRLYRQCYKAVHGGTVVEILKED